MELSEGQKLEFESHLDKAGVSFVCPMCKHDALTIFNELWELPVFTKGNGIASSKHALISLFCKNCKFVAPFSATKLGILSIE